MRNQYLPWMVCAAIAGVATPALASGSESRSANAYVDTYDNYFKDLVDGDTRADIAPGETVYFRSPQVPTNPSPHNVAFRDGPQPSVCNQTKQSPGRHRPAGHRRRAADAGRPLPQGWEGYCTFTAPGTYEFFCQAHGGMDGHGGRVGDADRDRHADADADADGHGDRNRDGHLDAAAGHEPGAGARPPRRRPQRPRLSPRARSPSSPTPPSSAPSARSASPARWPRAARSASRSATARAPRRARRRCRYPCATAASAARSSSPPADARRAQAALGHRHLRRRDGQAHREGQPLTRSRRCRRSCAASSTSLWRHSAAR